MLYFDQIDHDRFGTVRQQIWAVLHFPLHIGILLTVEGSSEFMLWRLGVELINWATNTAIQDSRNVQSTADLIKSLNETFITVSHRFTAVAPLDYSEQFKELAALDNSTAANAEDKYLEVIQSMLSDTYAWVFENLGVEVPEKDASEEMSGEDKLNEISAVFTTVFLYFFIAAGCTLLLLSVMYYFGKKHKTRGELASVATRFVVGAGLALIATMYVPEDGVVLSKYIFSAWILPTVTLGYGLGES